MRIEKLLKWYRTMEDNGLPRFIDIEDARKNQILTGGRWKKCIYSWGIIRKPDGWEYIQTDKKGDVIIQKKFHEEMQAAGYAKGILTEHALQNNPQNRAIGYMKKRFGYSLDEASKLTGQISADTEIFREFLNYMETGEFCSDNGAQAEACGCTAKTLYMRMGMEPVQAYVCLANLREKHIQNQSFWNGLTICH